MLKYKGYVYLDKEGRLHLLEDNGNTRTLLNHEMKSGYYSASLMLLPLTAPKMEDAFFMFSRAIVKRLGSY